MPRIRTKSAPNIGNCENAGSRWEGGTVPLGRPTAGRLRRPSVLATSAGARRSGASHRIRGNRAVHDNVVGVDVDDADYAKKLQEKCLKAGLFFNAEDTFLVFFPALTIENDVVEKGLDILESCL